MKFYVAGLWYDDFTDEGGFDIVSISTDKDTALKLANEAGYSGIFLEVREYSNNSIIKRRKNKG